MGPISPDLRLELHRDVRRALGAAVPVERTAQEVLGLLGQGLGFVVGNFWLITRDASLHWVVDWTTDRVRRGAFLARSREMTFSAGIGLLGRVLAARAPLWLPDVREDESFLRAKAARAAGLGAGVAVPILMRDEEVVACLDFFRSSAAVEEPTVVDVLLEIGIELRQFALRIRAEWELREALLRAERATHARDALVAVVSEGAGRSLDEAAASPPEQSRLVELANLRQTARLSDALRESEARLRLFIDNAPAGIAMFDREMRYIAASRRWLDDYRVSGDVTGLGHYDVFPDVPERWKAVHRRALAGEILSSDGDCFERANGTTQWLKWEALPWRTAAGQIGGIMIAAEEITDRKRAESALRESRAFLNRITEIAPALLYIYDLQEARNVWINRSVLSVLGYSPGEVQAMGEDVLPALLHEADARRYPAHLEQLRRLSPGEVAQFEYRMRHKDGSFRWLSSSEMAYAWKDGVVTQIIGAAHDITVRKEAEETLRGALRLRDEFLAVASHELRTPLTALTLQLAGLRKHVAAEVNHGGERAAKKVDLAIRQTERLGALVEGLLDVSRMSTGRLQLELSTFDLRELASEVASRLTNVASRAGCVIRLGLGDPVQGRWDRSRLDQVVTNLLTNAIKYGAGSPIDVTLQANGAQAVLRIRDGGIGIADVDQERIFGRFERAVPTTQYGGLGLGLYISRQIVEAHGGDIHVESSPGSGATFIVRLPRGV